MESLPEIMAELEHVDSLNMAEGTKVGKLVTFINGDSELQSPLDENAKSVSVKPLIVDPNAFTTEVMPQGAVAPASVESESPPIEIPIVKADEKLGVEAESSAKDPVIVESKDPVTAPLAELQPPTSAQPMDSPEKPLDSSMLAAKMQESEGDVVGPAQIESESVADASPYEGMPSAHVGLMCVGVAVAALGIGFFATKMFSKFSAKDKRPEIQYSSLDL